MTGFDPVDPFTDESLIDDRFPYFDHLREHGSARDRRYEHEPTYVLRGLRELHIEFTPAGDRRRAASPSSPAS